MNEFNNRIVMQRHILDLVNSKCPGHENLLGLSSKAIGRWVLVNGVSQESPILSLVRSASERLCFLANKSQEQISNEYQASSAEVERIAAVIEDL